METKLHLRQIILPLVFALVCFVVALGVWRSFGGSVPLEATGYRVAVELPQANSVFANTSVRMAGVSVGHVDEVEREGGRARVVLALDSEVAPLRRGASAILRTKTLLGESYVELAPGPVNAPVLADGGELALRADTKVQQRLEDVLETFPPQTRTYLRGMFDGMARAFRGRSEDLNVALGETGRATGGLKDALDVVARQEPRLRELISGSATVFETLGRRSSAVESAIARGSEVLDTLGRRERDLKATIDALPPFLTNLRLASNQLDEASGDLNRAVAAVRPTVPLVEPALRTFNRDTPAFNRLFTRLTPAMQAGRSGVPALTDTLDTARTSLPSVYRSARELIPTMKLAAANGESVVGSISNIGTTQSGTEVIDRTGRIDEQISITLIAFNEIIGGWAKKLPSNRANPYPRPGMQRDIVKNGVLSAFDCRNVNNPMTVPPTSGSAPPCIEQGPWEFDGKTAYYPRLELDKP